MVRIYVKVNLTPGADINEACEEAIYFSRTHDMNIEFNFNGCLIFCSPGSEIADLVNIYRNWCKAGTNNQKEINYD